MWWQMIKRLTKSDKIKIFSNLRHHEPWNRTWARQGFLRSSFRFPTLGWTDRAVLRPVKLTLSTITLNSLHPGRPVNSKFERYHSETLAGCLFTTQADQKKGNIMTKILAGWKIENLSRMSLYHPGRPKKGQQYDFLKSWQDERLKTLAGCLQITQAEAAVMEAPKPSIVCFRLPVFTDTSEIHFCNNGKNIDKLTSLVPMFTNTLYSKINLF